MIHFGLDRFLGQARVVFRHCSASRDENEILVVLDLSAATAHVQAGWGYKSQRQSEFPGCCGVKVRATGGEFRVTSV
jgi:hypothetical protein